MRVVSRRVVEMSLSGGYVQSVRGEVRLVMVDVWGVPVQLMTMGGCQFQCHANECGEIWPHGYTCCGQAVRCERG
jgi:hypothetical protein